MTGPRTLAADYDLYEIAYLAGGPRRAVDTAVVALVESGCLRVTPHSGGLTVVEHRRRHSLEAAVLDAVGLRGNRSIDTVRWRLQDDERLHAVGQRLERDGLARGRTPMRLRHWHLLALTGEGRRTLRHLRSDPPTDRVAGETGALVVALSGPERMADADVRAAVFEPPRPARSRWSAPRDRYAAGYSPHSHGWSGGAADSGGFGGFGGGFCGDGGSGGGDGGGC
ncbi:TIGR04222 domain-containing membrane protein [Blastococcus sp. CT_GayMR16]|uniref:TIGR04222 domain-containing membrane protein n=1 Tax=Blastococcus sp. CT_GayMR16 TaxID=2559607 RepID=UPI0010738ED0|nr:TIGR04222 domain-containing membrane protein [Blastococcus sp. CT_GayMR16]TFV90538.1 TIGR04222 domain-containing membrane protein [Blastococcus sp. CT_GayMR16]